MATHQDESSNQDESSRATNQNDAHPKARSSKTGSLLRHNTVAKCQGGDLSPAHSYLVQRCRVARSGHRKLDQRTRTPRGAAVTTHEACMMVADQACHLAAVR